MAGGLESSEWFTQRQTYVWSSSGYIVTNIRNFQTISSTGSLVFYPESASVNAEAERLVREEGVFTNIVLSHVGYDIDQEIAANASEKIGLIVGAHSHTFLYTGGTFAYLYIWSRKCS